LINVAVSHEVHALNIPVKMSHFQIPRIFAESVFFSENFAKIMTGQGWWQYSVSNISFTHIIKRFFAQRGTAIRPFLSTK